MALVADAEKARAAFSPIRRDILQRLREPGSAVSLAEALGVSRQKVAYHLRALEGAGLIRLVETRPRRGCTEHVFVATADVFVIDPAVMGGPERAAVDAQDRFAAEHLVGVAASLVRDVARMREAAEAEGTRLLTLTVESELAFATPRDFDRFSEELTEAVAEIARRYASPKKTARRYRLVAAAHPSPGTKKPPTIQ